MQLEWKTIGRPGFFGRKRADKIAHYNELYAENKWRLVWIIPTRAVLFKEACTQFYERSYFEYLSIRPAMLDFICSFGEVIDNAPTNISSGFDYEKQESYSTHIQDIAIRNVLRLLGRKFKGGPTHLLVVRGQDSNGHYLNPGHIPFYDPGLITRPTLAPYWALKNSVEDFWQSNKWLQVLVEDLPGQASLPYSDGK